MKTIADLLAEHGMFCDLEPAQRALIAGCGHNKVFADGDRLMHEGDPANEFYAIRQGQVAIGIHVPQRGEVAIETLHPGEVVGWSWLFPPYRVHFDARAVGPVHAIAFDGACLRRKCEADPSLGYALMKRFASVLVARLKTTQLQLLDVYGSQR